MPILHTNESPHKLPFHADSFGWDAFERFCGKWLVSGCTLPNLNLASNRKGSARLKIVDAQRMGNSGERQYGIDFLLRMETGARWGVQCKRVKRFGKSELAEAIEKAEKGFGHHRAERFLLWVTGDVTAEATLLADRFPQDRFPQWTLWSAERLTNEFIIHTPPRECFRILEHCFGPSWAKTFFPVPDDLLIDASEFFARWEGKDRSFHHNAELFGRERDLGDLVDFASGGDGTKALILSAPGGVGKSRLLKALAVAVEANPKGRLIRFVNPDASQDSDMPRAEDLTKLTIIHDDAHRADIPNLLLTLMAKKESSGARMIFSTRPGVEDSLRERLMNAGYPDKDIITKSLPKLSKPAMVKLAASLMGNVREDAPRALAELSGGCALVAVVGAELIRKGELQSLDLLRSEDFAQEVFTRFEGEELARISSSLDKLMLKKLLKSIALLSPWQSKNGEASNTMANFLGIQRGMLEAACDSLQNCGLLVSTYEGLRVTPDLFSDHLVYDSCYSNNGEATEFISQFMEGFGKDITLIVLRNLAEAQWRAVQKHGEPASNIVAPLWHQFLKEFESATFGDRSKLLEKWKDFAIYLPSQSIVLAGWAMDLKTSSPMQGYDSLNSHNRVLGKLPPVLKPIAIWNDTHRKQALELLWRLETEFPNRESAIGRAYEVFSKVASFEHNFPKASMGVLDWIERKLASEEGAMIADKPCGLLNIVLRPYFARSVEITYWQGRRSCVFERKPVSVTNTKNLRHRALSLITERIIPRGTVAAVKVLPVLGEAIRSSSVADDVLEPPQTRSWLSERKLALKAIEETSVLYRNHWVHFVIRQQLKWRIVYGKEKQWRERWAQLNSSLLDNFESRLTRLTVSSEYDDSLECYHENQEQDCFDRQSAAWRKMLQETVTTLLSQFTNSEAQKQFLEAWSIDAARHGFDAKFGELFSECGRQQPESSLGILDAILKNPDSCLSGFAATLLSQAEGIIASAVASRFRLGLASSSESIVCSFLNVFACSTWLQTEENVSRVLELAKSASGSVFRRFLQIVQFTRECPWLDSLGLILAKRNLLAEETYALAIALEWQEKYCGGTFSEATIDALLERLAQVPSLSMSGDENSYIHWLAKKCPLKLYQLFRKRIEISEEKAADNPDLYAAMPYYGEVSLSGLVDLPDFESLANELLENLFSRPLAARHPWRELFIACVSRASPLLVPLLTKRLSQITQSDDLSELVQLLRFKQSVVVFRHPELVKSILVKARNMGMTAFDEIQKGLIAAAQPTMRSYINGELDNQYRYALAEAEKAYAMHSDDVLLGPFYMKIVEIEKAENEYHKRRSEASFGNDWG